ncbi:ABC transporter permease subunit [Nocardia sp. SYP-A9097]|uniref:ABC transporter permease n=1 Tax=Nocardia sp. SYP-A9097 TaxID=2663237 RepID=UPI00129B5314|nr:ABC transporter permease [Nocardia sp. SYP-A9097]MRH91240.1 ABC transporter permease subunit [Nocardia sp. SYP-A9097]
MSTDITAATPETLARTTSRRIPPIGTAVAGVVLAAIALAALAPGLIAGSPDAIDPAVALRPPGGAHLFGTDWLGRDVYARVVHGTRASLLVGIGSTALACVVGTLWGLAAGLGGRIADQVAMRAADIFLSFPAILMALLVVAILGPGTGNVTIAVTVALAPGFARMVRIRTLLVRQFAYVRAALDLGIAPWRVAVRHIAPNVLLPLGVLIVINIGTAIIIGASLSFLGLGSAEASVPEWGSMLAQSRNYLSAAWTLALFPGLAVTLTVLTVSVLGRTLRAAAEGRSPQ